MSDLFNLVLTAEQQEQIRLQKAEKAKLEGIIVDAQKRMASIDEFLDAVAKVTGAANASSSGMNGSAAPNEPRDAGNMTEAIEKIANESAAPVSRKKLREMLAAQGFPADRLGNYFYTVVHRLKNSDRITVTVDGSVTRRPEAEPIRRRV